MLSNESLHIIEKHRVFLDFVNHDPLIAGQCFNLSAKVVGSAHKPQKFCRADEIKPLRGGKILLEPGSLSRSAGAKQKKCVIGHWQQACKHGEHFNGKNAREQYSS
jgi:hypothetical protein